MGKSTQATHPSSVAARSGAVIYFSYGMPIDEGTAMTFPQIDAAQVPLTAKKGRGMASGTWGNGAAEEALYEDCCYIYEKARRAASNRMAEYHHRWSRGRIAHWLVQPTLSGLTPESFPMTGDIRSMRLTPLVI
jgi:hypothetical protein